MSEVITLSEHHARQYSLVEGAGIFDENLEATILEGLFSLPPTFTQILETDPKFMDRSVAVRLISLLLPKRADGILVVGIEDGFTVSLLEELGARVFVIEPNGMHAQKIRRYLDSIQYTQAVTSVTPIEYGLKEYAPYDGILFHGIPKSIPTTFFDQLEQRGRIVSLVGDTFTQEVTVFEKKDNAINRIRFEIVQGYCSS